MHYQDELCERLGSRVSQAGRHLHPLLDRGAPAWALPVVGQGAHPDGKPWQLYIVRFISNSGQHKSSNTRRYSPNSDTSLAHLPQMIRLPTISQFFCARNFNCCCAFPRCLIVCSLHSSTRVQHLNGTTLNTALLGKKILCQNLYLISIFVSKF